MGLRYCCGKFCKNDDQAPHGTGAHCAPARGKARSACTRTGGTGRRPVPWCTVHRRYRRCSGPAPLVIPQAITYKTPRTLEIARARLQRRVQPYTSRVVFYRKVESETAASLLALGLSLLPAKAALLRHDMSPSWRQRIARRRSRQSSSIPAWSPSSAASRTSPQLQAAGQRVAYQDEAIECAVRHKFSAHHKAWQPWRRCHSHVTSLEPDLVSHHTVPYLLLYHIYGMCMCMCMCMLHVHTYVLYVCVTVYVYVSCVCVCRDVSFSSIFSVFHTV